MSDTLLVKQFVFINKCMVSAISLSSYYEKFLATGEVKCIDEEIPFEIPEGWEWCRLNDLALYRKGPFGSSLTKSMFVAKNKHSIKVYEQKNAIQKDYTLGDYYINKEKFETMQSFVVKPNDIIVSCAGTIGETYLLPSDAPVGIINQALMRVTLFDLNMAEYWQIYFAFILLNEAQMKGAGSAIKNIPPFEYLKAVLVAVPPLLEQNRLAERYYKLLSLIDKYESEANKLNSLNQKIYGKLKKSILQEAIQGKLVPQITEEGTAQELLEQIKAEKQKLVKEGKLKKSTLSDSIIFRGDDNKYYEQVGKKCLDITEQIPFEIPENWVWTRLGQIGDWGAGSTPQRGNANYYNGNILWLKTGELNNGIVYDTEEKITQKAFQDCSLRMNRIGDVLIAMYGATIGKLAVVGKELTTNQACCGCTPYLIYNWYLFYFLMASRDTFIKKGEGGAQPNISRVKLVEHLIPLPPIKEQQRIVAQIEKLFEQLR
jgi:type I restriction enzyme S subunit